MADFDAQNEFEQAARLLNDLQEQLLKYKSALDSIDGAASQTRAGAEALSKVASLLDELGKTQLALKKDLHETRRSLVYTQQKAEHFRKEIDRISQNVVENLNVKIQKRAALFDRKLEETFSTYNIETGGEIHRLKYYFLANLAAIVLLFFTVFHLHGDRDDLPPQSAISQTTQQPSARASDGQATPAAEKTPEAVTATTGAREKIQVLNGCGVPGIAQRFKSFLEDGEYHFNIVNVENAQNFDFENTIIWLHNPAYNDVRIIATELGLPLSGTPVRIIEKTDSSTPYDVSIVLGKDYATLRPFTVN